jgi:uncharacterized protein (DUF305 family)
MRVVASTITTTLAMLGMTAIASAQDQNQDGAPSSDAQPAIEMAQNMPEACQRAAQTAGGGGMMQHMPMMQGEGMGMMQDMPMMQGMSETNRGLLQAMMAQMPAMMQGLMASDPDVAFICAMIPHHQSAINMARVVLEQGDDADTKRMAEKIISEQEKEIAEMTAWLSEHVK